MSDKSRLISVEGKYFEVKLGNKGFEFNKISDKEYLDKVADSVVLGDVEVQLSENNIFQSVVDSAQESLIKGLEKNIKDTVLSVLGFEKDRWGSTGYKVDHCNGRMSSVTDLISKKVKERILEVELDQDFTLTTEEKAQLKKEMRVEFVTNYKNHMRKIARQNAQSLAEKHIHEYVAELVKNKTEDIANTMMNTLLTSKPNGNS